METAAPGMFICICQAIREREVDAAVRAGARRPADVFRACGKSPQCGSCACDMRERIAQTRACDQSVMAAPNLLAAD
jgi:bacterioferritin-associated ferredoxin